jgi:hypothetical protein
MSATATLNASIFGPIADGTPKTHPSPVTLAPATRLTPEADGSIALRAADDYLTGLRTGDRWFVPSGTLHGPRHH